ncbi:hypothetical protein ACFWY9_28730 [Amycolatopsis sp. NPDC059027]|uniref:hypothetical protein n=1 Tax=Amycolatopsis sp. NPDC059027 TaxID=3346709 RepID=UPI003672CA26
MEKDGDEIIGTIRKIGQTQPFEDIVPRVFMTSDEGEEFHYDATLTWIRNALLRERPEPGTKIRIWRGPKKGKQVTGGVEVLSDGGLEKVKPKTAAKPAESSSDDLPPF